MEQERELYRLGRESLDTYRSRVKIGFQERDTWRDAPAYRDWHSLTIQGHPVMEDWEHPYMERLAAVACSNGGTVLEVGFGMGISAAYVQGHTIDRHVVVEANAQVYGDLERFAAHSRVPVTSWHGFWEDVLPQLRDYVFDGILFDTYPLRQEDVHANHFPFFSEAYRLLKPGGVLTYYSDEAESFSPEHLAALRDAGFTNIDYEVCKVSPPSGCKYWTSPTILVPIIWK